MSAPFMGELRMFGFAYAPKGWAFANGQTMAISQNQALFALLGTTYGGDGINTFMLPTLKCSTAISRGNGFTQGQVGGETSVTLNIQQIPFHTHPFFVSSAAAVSSDPAGLGPALAASTIYGPPAAALMDPIAVSPNGGNQAHDNMPPSLVINWCIALTGIFPSRN